MANTTVGNIGIQITSNAQQAIQSLKTLSGATKTSSTSMKGLEANVKNISNATQKMAGTFNNVKSIALTSLGIGSLNQAINTLSNLIGTSTKNAVNLIENYNLFTVSMKGASTTQEEYNANLEQGLEFQNQLNTSFGVAISNSMRYQGFFRNLASSLGLSNNASMLLSENLTKLTYDLASLYNTDFNTMYSKLQSGLVGQTKPLRSVGVDVTMQTLQPTLYSLDINKKVSELTQAQKVMLRYIEILRQTTSAQGDMARTIESPANQLRILSDQWQELTMWLGTLFIGVLGKVLPYLNAVVMTLKEIFKYLSDLFGFKLSDYKYLTMNEDVANLTDGLDDATNSSEELKKSLAGFDELNILSDQQGSISATTEDIYVTKKLEDAMESYDNLMGSVRTKAKDISDRLLEMIGFQKELNKQTGEYEWTWKGIEETDWDSIFSGIYNAIDKAGRMWFSLEEYLVKKQPIVGETIVNMFSSIIKNIFSLTSYLEENIKKLVSDFTIWIGTKIVENIGNPFNLLSSNVQNIFTTIANAIATTFTTIVNDAIAQINKLIEAYNSIPVLSNLSLITPILGETSTYNNEYGVAGGTKYYRYTDMSGKEYKATSYDYILSIKNAEIAKLKASGSSSYIGQAIAAVQAKQIQYYADGGFPSAGQMFIARENGAEMVGSIGNKTAVANNDQIVSAVAQGVASAVSNVLGNGSSGSTVNIYLDDVLVGNALIDSINRATKNTGNTILAL